MKRLIAVISFIFLAACGGGGGGSNASSKPIAKMDISDAANLAIIPTKVQSKVLGASTSTVVNKLFKITKDGYMLEVTYKDESGNSVSTQSAPTAIYDVNSEHVIVSFANEGAYLVTKSTGVVYSIAKFGSPITNTGYHYLKLKSVFTDANDNVYFLTSRSTTDGVVRSVVKLNVSNLNAITGTFVTPITDDVSGFIVDKNGNIVYGDRLVKNNGELQNLTTVTSINYMFWRGLNGHISITSWPYTKQINVDASYKTTLIDYYATPNSMLLMNAHFLIEMPNRILIASNDYGYVNEIDNISGTGRIVANIDLSTIRCAANSNNFYYLAGNTKSGLPSMLKVDPSNDSITDMLPSGQYEVLNLAVSSTDEITFSAIRMADQAKIIGRVDSKGHLNIIDATSNADVIALERIN